MPGTSIFARLADHSSRIAQVAAGEPVICAPAAGGEFEVPGIPSTEASRVDAGGEREFATGVPSVNFRKAVFAAGGYDDPANGDRLTLQGTVYEIVEIEDAGAEWRCLLMEIE